MSVLSKIMSKYVFPWKCQQICQQICWGMSKQKPVNISSVHASTCAFFFWVVMPRSKELKLDSHWGHPIFEGFFCHRNCVPVPCDSLPVETLIVVGLLASSFPYDFGLAKRIGSLHTFSILSKTIIYIYSIYIVYA